MTKHKHGKLMTAAWVKGTSSKLKTSTHKEGITGITAILTSLHIMALYTRIGNMTALTAALDNRNLCVKCLSHVFSIQYAESGQPEHHC